MNPSPKKQWEDVLQSWENGFPLRYPRSVKGSFQWNTSVLKDDGRCDYVERFRTNPLLPAVQNTAAFREHIDKSKNPDVISFSNPSKDTVLVVPMPHRGNNHSTLRDFIDNAPLTQQQAFWKKVAQVARKSMAEHGSVWVSVHGLGVAYTHVRVSTGPKYYFDRNHSASYVILRNRSAGYAIP